METDPRRRRGHAVRPRLPLAVLRHRRGADGGRARGCRYILIHEKKISNMKDLLPLLEQVAKAGKAAADHRRGRRRRGAGHPGGQQAARHAERLRRQGARLRRSPQGDAEGHRDPHRRPGDHRGPRPQARERTLEDLGSAKRVTIDKDNTTIIDGAGKKDIQGACAQIRAQIEETTSDYDREKLQERLAKLVGGVAVDQGRRGHRDRDEGEEGSRRGRAARDPRGRRRGHRSRWRRGADPRAAVLDKLTTRQR